MGLANQALGMIDLVPITTTILLRAGELQPPALRTLDAIHLATALEVGPIDAFVTYDTRLADAARAQNLVVAAPA
jgi:predicted nucleic acid-binding protein